MKHAAVFLVLVTGVSHAIMIDGEDLTIDEAIVKASDGGASSAAPPDSILVEHDMIFHIDTYVKMKTEQERFKSSSGGRMKRKAIIPEYWYRWTNRVIPFEISSDFSKNDQRLIDEAIKEYHKYTCLRFVPADPSVRNKIRFVNGGGCSSYVGMVGGTQPVTLARGCRYKGIIVHELGHAIGFQHEQNRPDRDDYVTIEEQNIESGKEYNFDKYTKKQVSTYGVPYDYTSVMHYGQRAFSKNGKITIIAKDPTYQTLMGNRQGLSYRDIKLANLMYHCAANERCKERGCPKDGFVGKDCKCWCPTDDRSNPVKHCDVEPVVPTKKPSVLEWSKEGRWRAVLRLEELHR